VGARSARQEAVALLSAPGDWSSGTPQNSDSRNSRSSINPIHGDFDSSRLRRILFGAWPKSLAKLAEIPQPRWSCQNPHCTSMAEMIPILGLQKIFQMLCTGTHTLLPSAERGSTDASRQSKWYIFAVRYASSEHARMGTESLVGASCPPPLTPQPV
jgi:hypothetical protein